MFADVHSYVFVIDKLYTVLQMSVCPYTFEHVLPPSESSILPFEFFRSLKIRCETDARHCLRSTPIMANTNMLLILMQDALNVRRALTNATGQLSGTNMPCAIMTGKGEN
jgi:hypothetical protein